MRNQSRPWDFGEHAQSRANGMSPIVDHQSTVNRSSCGRRTSLRPCAEPDSFCSGVTYIYSFIRNQFASQVPHLAIISAPIFTELSPQLIAVNATEADGLTAADCI